MIHARKNDKLLFSKTGYKNGYVLFENQKFVNVILQQ